MRKSRPLLFLLALIPLVAIGLGAQYWMRTHRSGGSPDASLARLIHPNSGTAAPDPSKHSDSRREQADTSTMHEEKKVARKSGTQFQNSVKGSAHTTDSHDEDVREETTEDIEREARAANAPSAADLGEGLLTPSAAQSGSACNSIEYRGAGMKGSAGTDAEWKKAEAQFANARESLLAWLQKRRKEIADKTVSVMENQLKSVKLERPPVADEPDLSWRGIGVFTYNSKGAPFVRLGGGFLKLVVKDAKRSQFELTRLLAQAWAPCEIQKLDPMEVWSPLLDCLKVSRETACAPGTAAEEGWAVSSTLAAILHPPGCQLPGLSDASARSCLDQLPLPLTPGKEVARAE